MNVQELLEKQWVLNQIKETAHRITLQLVDSFEKYPWLKEKIFEISDGEKFVYTFPLLKYYESAHEQVIHIIEEDKNDVIFHSSESVYEELLKFLNSDESQKVIYKSSTKTRNDLVSSLIETLDYKKTYSARKRFWSDRYAWYDKFHITPHELNVRFSSQEMLEGTLFSLCESLVNKEWEGHKKYESSFPTFEEIDWYSYFLKNVEGDLVRQVRDYFEFDNFTFSEIEQMPKLCLNIENALIYKNIDFESYTQELYKRTKQDWFDVLQDYEVFLEDFKEDHLDEFRDSHMLRLLEYFENESLIDWYVSYVNS